MHQDIVPLSYSLEFDAEWNLHIMAYLFEPGDLLEGDSWLMGNWAYLNDDGFYPVEGNRFDSVEMIVTITKCQSLSHRIARGSIRRRDFIPM